MVATSHECCRSLGETAGNFRNADKSEGNRITCRLSDTTGVYHRQGVAYELPLRTTVVALRVLPARLKGK